jgi:hypothetical protein
MDALSQCIDFLGAIFEPEDIIEFRPLPPAAGRRWSTLTEIPDIIDWLERLNRDENQRVHAYFGANPRKEKNASQAEGVALARCVFADFDGGVVVEDSRCPQPSLKAVAEFICGGGCQSQCATQLRGTSG